MNDENPWSRARPSQRSPDKRERERRRDEADAANRPARTPSRDTPRRESPSPANDIGAGTHTAVARDEERWYGTNACLAAFAKRPHDLRKVWLTEARLASMKPVLAWCVQQRIGYRIVEGTDLDRLTASRHHEGVCFDMRPAAETSLGGLLATATDRPSTLLWLDGVGNPHNLGALLRTAAHFGVDGVIVPEASTLRLSGAAARVAEGAAEAIPLVRVTDTDATLDRLRAAGYRIAATVPRDGDDLYGGVLPARLLLVLGAEGEGVSKSLAAAADLRLTIPGSGLVESLNIAASAAVMLGESWRQRNAAERLRP